MADELVLHRGVGAPSRCRSCNAPIVFAELGSGKLGPFQADDQGVWILENGKARHVGKAGPQLELGAAQPQHYTSHFATCPAAAKWRSNGDD